MSLFTHSQMPGLCWVFREQGSIKFQSLVCCAARACEFHPMRAHFIVEVAVIGWQRVSQSRVVPFQKLAKLALGTRPSGTVEGVALCAGAGLDLFHHSGQSGGPFADR